MKQTPQVTMTAQQLNRRISTLHRNLYLLENDVAAGREPDYYERLRTLQDEFSLIYAADPTFTCMNKRNIALMLRINLRYRFIGLHQFGISIALGF